MNILIVGATGKTGRLLTAQLLEREHYVKAIVRSPHKLPEATRNHPNLTTVQATLLDLTDSELASHVKDCDAVASCLGHNLTIRGMFGPPWKLVTDATRRLCQALLANPVDAQRKFVLMNTTGNQNRDLDEQISSGEKSVTALIRLLLPPHSDNEQAADYLRTEIGQNHAAIDWVAVRPDGLIDEDAVSEYSVVRSPTRSAIFNAGKTSRINVGHFMADLITDEQLWQKWKGQMPVIYNEGYA